MTATRTGASGFACFRIRGSGSHRTTRFPAPRPGRGQNPAAPAGADIRKEKAPAGLWLFLQV